MMVQEWRFPCSICEYATDHSAQLKIHVRAVHEKVEVHACGKCKHLNIQVKSVHFKRKDHMCQKCEGKFSTKNRLTLHDRKGSL